MAGEFDLIQWIRSRQRRTARVALPAGDDLAVLRWDAGDLLLVGVDQVLDGVHFDARQHSPRQIGRKVMNRNLSDCAAMACLPAAAVVTVALHRGDGIDYARELYLGLQDAAEVFGCQIVGGDTATWDQGLVVTVTILGRSAGIEPITRSGGKPGDGIYVTGPLGGSILGRHMTFAPKVHEARHLAAGGHVHAMIDISDGLSGDLRHLCEAGGVGAVLDEGAIPIHADAVQLSAADFRSPLDHALHDGEDHELLLMADASLPGATRIGSVTAAPGMFLRRADGSQIALTPAAWQHRLD